MSHDVNPKSSTGALKAAIFDYGGVMSFSPLWRVRILAEAMEVPEEIFAKTIFGPPAEGESNPWHEAECGRQAIDEIFAQKMQDRLTPYGARFDLDVFLPWVAEAINQPDPEMVQVVKELRAKKFPVGLLTNAVREFRPVIERTVPIYELFDVIVDSSEVGMRKPDRSIYDLTARQLGVRNSECLMIDDLEANVVGAEEAEMHGLVFEDSRTTALKIRRHFNLQDDPMEEI